MTQQAVVKQILPEGRALVEIRRQSACGHDCAGCGLCAPGAPLQVCALNRVGAREGDVVTVSSSTRRVLKMAAVVYLSPVLLFFAGYAAGHWVGIAPAPAGGVGFVLGLVAIWLAGRQTERHSPLEVGIVSIDGGD